MPRILATLALFAVLAPVAAAAPAPSTISGTITDPSGRPANGTVAVYLNTDTGPLPGVAEGTVSEGRFELRPEMTPQLEQAAADGAGSVDLLLTIVSGGYSFVRPFVWELPDPAAPPTATAAQSGPGPVFDMRPTSGTPGVKRLRSGAEARMSRGDQPPYYCRPNRKRLSRFVTPVRVDAMRTVPGARLDYRFSVIDGYTLGASASADFTRLGLPALFSISGKKDTGKSVSTTTFSENGRNSYVAASTIFEYTMLEFPDEHFKGCPRDTTVNIPTKWAENLRRQGRPSTSFRCNTRTDQYPGSQPFAAGRELVIDKSTNHEIARSLRLGGISLDSAKRFGKGTTMTYSFKRRGKVYWLCGPDSQKELSGQRTLYMAATRARG